MFEMLLTILIKHPIDHLKNNQVKRSLMPCSNAGPGRGRSRQKGKLETCNQPNKWSPVCLPQLLLHFPLEKFLVN